MSLFPSVSSYQSSPRNIGKGSRKTIRYIIILRAGIFSINKKTLEITDANRKFAQIIHYQCSDLIKKNLSDIITVWRVESFLANLHDFCRVEDIEGIPVSARDCTGRSDLSRLLIPTKKILSAQ